MFRYETRTDLMIARNAMEFIAGVSIPTSGSEQQREAKFSGKHAPHLMFLMDEADAVPDEVYRGIESCMSGGNTRLLCMFNPRTPSGAVYRMIRDGKAHVVKLIRLRASERPHGRGCHPRRGRPTHHNPAHQRVGPAARRQ